FHQRRKLSDRRTVVTYDQRGHGHSDAPDDATRYSGAHLARDLAGIVDALSFDKVAIVGFSLGGGPALALAAARPERITHLVLADVGSGADGLANPVAGAAVGRLCGAHGLGVG